MLKTVVRNADHTLVRVPDHIVIIAISTSIKVTLNLISAVLKHHTMIILTLEVSHNVIFLRVNINIVILII